MGEIVRHLNGRGAFRVSVFLCVAAALAAFAPNAFAISLQLSPNSTTRSASAIEADYSSTHLYVDEINGDSIPITIFFDPGTTGVDEADVFTNLNNRDLANVDNGSGVPSGIVPPNGNSILAGTTGTYFAAYKMSLIQGGYQITLNATKTGAYRLTARYHLQGDPATTWHWYGDFVDGGGVYNFRDAAIVVSPTKARSMVMYELNVLNVDAEAPSGETDSSHRSTFVDLYGGPGATTQRPFNLTYAKNMGVNWLWLQPIHPIGVAGRQLDPNNGSQPFAVGSPYAVKNFFAVNPAMSKAYDGSDDDAGRSAALTEFQGFVKAADSAGENVMLDVPFNHTAFDCELGDNGQQVYGQPLFGNAQTASSTQFWNLEARVYSRWNGGSADQTNSNNLSLFDYGERAADAGSIALAADRFDFGKFIDVHDVYFGHYASLVDLDIAADENLYTNEGDWFDYSIGPNGVDAPNNDASQNSGNGHFDSITQNVWKYFADYIPYWLAKTGHVDSNGNLVGNSTLSDPVARRTADDLGIDGIRADFAQGLPPQLWDYIINVSRSYKWDFVFLCESLDGGSVTYRSGRDFDVLNENVLFDFYNAQSTSDFRNLYDNRRNAYGQALVLWDTESHDEAGYNNPYQALMRFACSGAIDGTPDIFFGQEIGISGAVEPPSSNPTDTPFGFSLYQVNFGKPIPQFMTYNSLAPAWNALGQNSFGQAEIYPVYSAIGNARANSPALQSSNRFYLNDMNGNAPSTIFGVAKYATANASPATSDVVFAFVNLALSSNSSQVATFNVNISQNGSNLFGINSSRTYNVRNIAADTRFDTTRNTQWLWGTGRTGSDVIQNGVFVSLNPLPTLDSTWQTAPYEAQYLKLYDITAPPSPPASVSAPRVYPYVIGSTATFTWAAVAADSAGIVPSYSVIVTINGVTSPAVITSGTSYTVPNLTIGEQVSVTVAAVNPNYTAAASSSSTTSPTIKVLDPNADDDGDGMSNSAEDIAGTNPLDVTSFFRVVGMTRNASTNSGQITWASVVGKSYQVEFSPTLSPKAFTAVGSPITATGTLTTYSFQTSGTTGFYEVIVSQ
jgi:hypothetical protein